MGHRRQHADVLKGLQKKQALIVGARGLDGAPKEALEAMDGMKRLATSTWWQSAPHT